VCVCVCECVCVSVWVSVCVCVWVSVCVWCVCVWVSVCVCVWVSVCECVCVCVCVWVSECVVSIMGISKRMVPKVLCMAATKLMVNWWLHHLAVSICTSSSSSSSLPLNFKIWFNNLIMVSLWIYCIQKDWSNYSCGTDATPHSNFAVKQKHLTYGPVFYLLNS